MGSRRPRGFGVVTGIALMAGCAGGHVAPAKPDWSGQPKARIEAVIDTVHGVEVADPYRWLEDGDSAEVRTWADAQDAATRRVLDAVPGRERMHARIKALAEAGRIFGPELHGGRVFLRKREGAQNQPILYVRDAFDAPERVAIDPNLLSRDGTVAMDWFHPSRDGRKIAYGTSVGGSELSTLRVRDLETGRDLPDEIPNCRAAAVAWLRDGSGFYYTRYPAPGSVPEGEERYHRRVFFHRLGDDPASDAPVFGEGRAKEDWAHVSLSRDDRWLLVTVYQGWSKSELYVRPREGGEWTTVVEGVEASTDGVIVGDTLWLLTNDGAPRLRIMSAPVSAPARSGWREVVPEGEATIEGFDVVGGRIVTRELVHAAARARIFGLDGRIQGQIPLPTLGTMSDGMGEPEGDDYVFTFSSFFLPPALYRYRVGTSQLSMFASLPVDVDTSRYEARQEWVTSKDGTKVSMFIVHPKGVKLDGRNRVLLSGYGGFNISMKPGFGSFLMAWLESGGVYAMPNLRGGGEYGEAWHQAGMLGRKQNVFDDFIASAEKLVADGWTTPSRLAISGGSNGGLLVGAALTQRPDLFGAVLCGVPLLDMVRYPRFLIARLWIPEYGDPEQPEAFAWLHAYSPYHRVKEGTRYPATLLMTADRDSRVDPCHARKMAARLQAANAAPTPILLRVEKMAGHGAGKPLSKVIDEMVDELCFLELALE